MTMPGPMGPTGPPGPQGRSTPLWLDLMSVIAIVILGMGLTLNSCATLELEDRVIVLEENNQ